MLWRFAVVSERVCLVLWWYFSTLSHKSTGIQLIFYAMFLQGWTWNSHVFKGQMTHLYVMSDMCLCGANGFKGSLHLNIVSLYTKGHLMEPTNSWTRWASVHRKLSFFPECLFYLLMPLWRHIWKLSEEHIRCIPCGRDGFGPRCAWAPDAHRLIVLRSSPPFNLSAMSLGQTLTLRDPKPQQHMFEARSGKRWRRTTSLTQTVGQQNILKLKVQTHRAACNNWIIFTNKWPITVAGSKFNS